MGAGGGVDENQQGSPYTDSPFLTTTDAQNQKNDRGRPTIFSAKCELHAERGHSGFDLTLSTQAARARDNNGTHLARVDGAAAADEVHHADGLVRAAKDGRGSPVPARGVPDAALALRTIFVFYFVCIAILTQS